MNHREPAFLFSVERRFEGPFHVLNLKLPLLRRLFSPAELLRYSRALNRGCLLVVQSLVLAAIGRLEERETPPAIQRIEIE